jgi:beta-mannosidase
VLKKLDLCGHWTFRETGKRENLPAKVPGSVYADLLRAGRIPDPFYRDNEAKTQWIGEADWSYRRAFTVPQDLLRRDRVLLRCDGLDTLATILINGKPAGAADNQHRTWEFDIKRLLKPGRNTIDVRFASAMAHVRAMNKRRRLPGWGVGDHKLDTGGWIRKQPCNFGWDWGPSLVTCGIWRDIAVHAFDTARLADVSIRQQHSEERVDLDIAVTADRASAGRLLAEVEVSFEGRTVASGCVAFSGASGRTTLRVDRPKLWWPNGLGAQPLYRVDVRLATAADPTQALDALTRRIGLRTLELVREKDAWGESFCFACNGKRYFAKGANWIPADAVLARLTYDEYWRPLNAAASVNMNMLRVWGGGIYEHDTFYELCDELGLCVWQDFMFACATYPTFDRAFMANVRAEAEDNVRRLRHHASIALWCGNNEMEQGLVADRWTQGQMSWKDYSRLFDRLLPEVLRRLDPDRPYWPCSPHSPVGDRKDFNNPTCGDAHLWAVWHGREPFEWYRSCEHRFNSEFGFQSFPEPRTVRAFTEPGDRNITSPIMEWHQRSGIGNATILHYMLSWFRMPTSFDMTLWLSQVLQGLAMKYAVEHWRRSMPRGMGTLYWQLNDCWPVASWASIDGCGRWKALHYMARHFYAPVLISAVEDARTGHVEVHVTNDRPEAFEGVVHWDLLTVDGEVLVSDQFPAGAPERASRRVKTLDLAQPLKRFGASRLLVHLRLEQEDGAAVSENLSAFAKPKTMNWQDPRLSIKVRPAAEPACYDVTVTSRRPALWMWLEVEDTDATFSDNFVHLLPGRARTLTVQLQTQMDRKAFRDRLRVRSLIDTFAVEGG